MNIADNHDNENAGDHNDGDENKVLWSPHHIENTRIYDFIQFLKTRGTPVFNTYEALHDWSIENLESFWSAVWDFANIKGDKGDAVISKIDHVPWARFFNDSKISYAENILKHVQEKPDGTAIFWCTQDKKDTLITWQTLYDEVSIWQQALEQAGIKKGDTVGVYLPNVPQAIYILLAASNIGAVFCSAGMEMGADDLIGRFEQANPKIMIMGAAYIHGKKTISRTDVAVKIIQALPCIERIIIMPPEKLISGEQNSENSYTYPNTVSNTQDSDKLLQFNDFIGHIKPEIIKFKRHDFNHPLYILFSSGSTGKPKCFEHSSGGILLKHLSEYIFHADVRAEDHIFYHATPSWMMWNWLVSGLAVGASIMLYDGSPAYPDLYAQWDFTARNGCTHHGSAAPLLLSFQDHGISPKDKYDLSTLRMVLSTGAVLPPKGFSYIHECVKRDVKISPISGGTDIVGCFVSGNPMTPTYAGQINAPVLGMDVRVWNEDGSDAPIDEAGELVCVNAFPSMPFRFLDDQDGERYTDEYFRHYPGRYVWRHGDSIIRTAQGQLIIVGRSDATLNQNGVRIGASTIYKQLDVFKDQIEEAAAVDFKRPDNSQAITILFLKLKSGADEVPADLQKAICLAIKNNVTPYAIPTKILACPGVLKTPNGKTAEVVIKKAINGQDIKNKSLYGGGLCDFYIRTGADLAERYS